MLFRIKNERDKVFALFLSLNLNALEILPILILLFVEEEIIL